MRILTTLLLLVLSTLAWSQPVLTITDAKRPNPVAPYVYFLEDFSHKLTYEQVARFPLDSFQVMKQKEIVQLGFRRGTVWMRFCVDNRTNADLFLISSFRNYAQFTVYVSKTDGTISVTSSGYSVNLASQQIPTVPFVIPLGQYPKMISIQIRTGDGIGDYLHISGMGQAVVYQKQMTRWQSLALGAYGVVFLFALLFYVRLRDPLIGWYALLMFSIIQFYLSFYGYLGEYINYAWWRQYVPVNLFYGVCWALFHIHFLNLRLYSKFLYWAIVGINMVAIIDYPISVIVTVLSGHPFSIMGRFFYWLGIGGAAHTLILLSLLLISLIWVSIRNFQAVYLYAVAFMSSLVTMIIALLALYDLDWLPFLPYNDLFVPGTLVEIVLLGYILGERANEHRRQQVRTQQQLIDQLQENLHQKNKLLQIRDEIARDLHDEVGATLTAIAISTKLVQKKVNGQQPDVAPILAQIQTDSQDTITAIRDTVWALNPDNDAPEKLFERLRAVGLQALANQDTDFTLENSLTPNDLPPFSMEQRRNIYFIFKEALHNIVKHAQATTVSVCVFQEGNQLHIRIADNGRGFEPTQTTEGNGLKNFQKRADEGGFSVRVFPKPGQGTTVEMRIPLPQTTNIGDGVAS